MTNANKRTHLHEPADNPNTSLTNDALAAMYASRSRGKRATKSSFSSAYASRKALSKRRRFRKVR